jgi:hypothetical protein
MITAIRVAKPMHSAQTSTSFNHLGALFMGQMWG